MLVYANNTIIQLLSDKWRSNRPIDETYIVVLYIMLRVKWNDNGIIITLLMLQLRVL